jgi:type I restriction enzyme S subunit
MNWPVKPLGEICEIVSGITKDSKKQGGGFREVPYLRVANVQRLRLDLSEVKTIPAKESAISSYRLEPGDILLNEGGDRDKLGRGWIWQGQISECIHQNHVFRARIRSGEAIPKWIAYFANTNESRAYFLATGKQTTNLASISKKNLSALPVPLPSIDIQECIVSEIDTQLSRLDEMVATLQGIQAKLKQARASILKAAVEGRLVETEAELARAKGGYYEDAEELIKRVWVDSTENQPSRVRSDKGDGSFKTGLDADLPPLPTGWACFRINEVGTVQLGRQRTPKDHSGPNMCPYMRVANVFEDYIDLSDVKEMNFTLSEQENFRLEYGDILLNEGQSPHLVGRPAMWRGEVKNACFQNTLVRFRSSGAVLPLYALIVFRSQLHARRYMKIAKITTNIAHLGAQRFAAVEFPLPPLAEQRRIIHEADRRFSVLDKVESTVKASLARCALLRQAILKRAFEGRLVPAPPDRHGP